MGENRQDRGSQSSSRLRQNVMNDMENTARIKFTNAVLIGIFGQYADNASLASIVDDKGVIDVTFRVSPETVPPTSCEQVLSLLFALFESNPGTKIGEIYMKYQKEILRETVYRLTQVLDGFTEVELLMDTKVTDENGTEVTKHTVTKIKHSKN